jgi:glycerol uptake facilitator protein
MLRLVRLARHHGARTAIGHMPALRNSTHRGGAAVIAAVVAGGAGGCSYNLLSSSSLVACAGTDDAPPSAGPSQVQKLLAEAIGTGMIVVGGCGVVCALKFAGHSVNALGIAAAFGTSVTLAIYATADISGAHLNPAVTASLVVNNGFSAAEGAAYMAAQCTGAAVAAALNYMAFSKGIAATEAAGKIIRGAKGSCDVFGGAFGMIPNKAVCSVPAACLVEVLITAGLVYCIYAFTDPNNKAVPQGAAPVLIGTTVAAFVHGFAPVTGAGMNPARDLGPRLVRAGFSSSPQLARIWVITGHSHDVSAPCLACAQVTMAAGWGGTALSSGWCALLRCHRGNRHGI